MAETSWLDAGTGGGGEGVVASPSASFDWSSLSGWGTGANIGAAGSGMQAFAQLAQGIMAAKRAKKLAAYNADILESNAQAEAFAAENHAQQYLRRAALTRQAQLEEEQLNAAAQAYREDRQREQHVRLRSQTRAIVASSGLMMSGSPLVVYEETVRQQELDILATRYQSALELRQSRHASTEAVTQDEYAAEMARFGGGERLRIGGTQAGLLRSNADGSAVGAGLLQAGATLSRGAATYGYERERRKSRTLLQDKEL